jgi:ribose 5-phosphate isomerase A
VNAKKLAAEKAVGFVKNGMTIGLGTGSTAQYAIELIGELVKSGLAIKVVASSVRSEEIARNAGITICSFSEITSPDLYIDGADEVDQDFNLIKGGGGALLREKILAYHSKEFIVIVDESKLVDQPGQILLPVEITGFAFEFTCKSLEELGCKVVVREKDGKHFITDNGNLIADCSFQKVADRDELQVRIKEIPGVVETGLFAKEMVSKVIVGYESGDVKIFGR